MAGVAKWLRQKYELTSWSFRGQEDRTGRRMINFVASFHFISSCCSVELAARKWCLERRIGLEDDLDHSVIQLLHKGQLKMFHFVLALHKRKHGDVVTQSTLFCPVQAGAQDPPVVFWRWLLTKTICFLFPFFHIFIFSFLSSKSSILIFFNCI